MVRSVRPLTALAVLSVLALLVGGPSASGAPVGTPPCPLSFSVVHTAGPDRPPSALAAVGARSGSDVWAVGEAAGHTMAQHWDGHGWAHSRTARPGAASTLFAVAPLASDDVWAVGAFDQTDGTHHGLVERYDGTRWHRIPGAGPFDLNGVDGVSPDDVWAVGAGPKILRWTGSGLVPYSAPPNVEEGELHAVDALAPDDVWAVGAREGAEGSGHDIAMLLHWDGSNWGLVTNPPIDGDDHELLGVSASSPTDVWAVGERDTEDGARTLVLHYDGAAWTTLDSPNLGGPENELAAVSALGPNDVWVAGTYVNDELEHPVVFHWDGSAWTALPTQEGHPGDPVDSVVGISARAGGDVWAVGLHGASDDVAVPLAEHLSNVSVTDAGFSPVRCGVDAGATVWWSVDVGDAGIHRIVDASEGRFDSGSLRPGSIFGARFDTPGTTHVLDRATGAHSSIVSR